MFSKYKSGSFEGFYKNGVLISFAKFTRKRLCRESLVKTVASCRMIKQRLQHWCFPVNFAKILRTLILSNFCKRLQITQNKSHALTGIRKDNSQSICQIWFCCTSEFELAQTNLISQKPCAPRDLH